MSNAWGHNVRPLTEAEIQGQIRMGESHYFWYEKNSVPTTKTKEYCIHLERKCRISKKCQNESTHMLTYRYITGRVGRVSYAEKPICSHHAEKYLINR